MIELGTWNIGRLSDYTYTTYVAEHKGLIYVFCSDEYWPTDHSALLAYNTQTGTWKELSTLPTVRFGFSKAIVNEKLYITGRSTSYENNKYNNVLKTVEIYDLNTGEWTVEIDRPTAGTNSAAAVVGNKIYCMGGRYAGSTTAYLDTVEVYDTAEDTWSTETIMPIHAYAFRGAPVGTNIYAIGSMNVSGGTTTACYKYDTLTKE